MRHTYAMAVFVAASALLAAVIKLHCFSSQMVKLRSSQGDIFEVELEVAGMSTFIKDIVDDSGTDEEIQLPNLTTVILTKVLAYCKHHKDNPPKKPVNITSFKGRGFSEWDSEYVNIEQEVLFELVVAAENLGIDSLLDLACTKVFDMPPILPWVYKFRRRAWQACSRGAALILVHSIPTTWTDADLHSRFSPFGQIMMAEITGDSRTKASKRKGVVSYTTPAAATLAVEHLKDELELRTPAHTKPKKKKKKVYRVTSTSIVVVSVVCYVFTLFLFFKFYYSNPATVLAAQTPVDDPCLQRRVEHATQKMEDLQALLLHSLHQWGAPGGEASVHGASE